MATVDTTTAFVEERTENYQAADENRSCEIRLHKDSVREHIDLSWHSGAKYKKAPTIRLKRGMTILAPIKKARAWFGYFTVPTDAENKSESERRDLMQLFQIETERTKMAWGDYPRPRKMSEGTDPIGPHRFPDVEVRVTEWDGSKWEWLRLHKLYNLGAFDPMQFHDPKADEQAGLAARNAELEAKNRAQEERIASIEGQMKALMAIVSKASGNAAR